MRSIQPRSNLGKLIATARGRELAESEMGTMDEAPAAGAEEALPTPVETMLAGVRVMAMVKHTEKGWADFHVDSATKAPATGRIRGLVRCIGREPAEVPRLRPSRWSP